MNTEARVVVIGGGIVGVAVLYHLTKLGWNDVVLLERKQLTAGSTWHAAAGFHSMNGSLNMARLQAYTIETYKEIQEISGQDVGLHVTGSITVASTPDRWDFLKSVWGLNETLGIESQLLTPDEIAERTCLIDTSEVLGGLFCPDDGYLDPYGATHAYAKAAQMAGAKIELNTKVEALISNEDSSWTVHTDKGDIKTEHVINAAGLWAREVGEMAGVKLPLIPYEHHYFITETVPDVVGKEESATIVDLDGEIYMRQEHDGVLYGVYEPGARAWAVDGTPWSYGENDLLPDRLDDLIPTLAKGFERFPKVEAAGIKTIVNGPFTFTPDGNPLMGPVRGLKNYWAACGCMAGFSQCGGIALALSQWMVNGEPEEDVMAMDVSRFGSFATQAFTLETSKQFYEYRFRVPFPNEAWPAGRPNKTTPIYDLLQSGNAVFAGNYGVEIPMWFANSAEEAIDIPSFSRSNSFDRVAEECMAVQSGVGILDASSFAKYEISGPGAEQWLNTLTASKIPNEGRARLSVLLTEKGAIKGDLTLMRLAANKFWLTGSGPLQEWHMRWFEDHLPSEGVLLKNVTEDYMCLAIAGPQSRDLLSELTRCDVSKAAMPFLAVREMDVAFAPSLVARLSLTGELGYEIYMPALQMRTVYQRIMEVGEKYDIRNFGIHALLSMRLEKGFGIWGREFSPDYTPAMNDMKRFIDYDKADFIGKKMVCESRGQEPSRSLVLMEIDATTADVSGFEPIWFGDVLVGFATSGGYGHRTKKSLALAYIDLGHKDASATYQIYLLGEKRAANIVKPPYDEKSEKMRA